MPYKIVLKKIQEKIAPTVAIFSLFIDFAFFSLYIFSVTVYIEQ